MDLVTSASVGSPFGCSSRGKFVGLEAQTVESIIAVAQCEVRIVFGYFDTGIVNSNLAFACLPFPFLYCLVKMEIMRA
jgi:hypothetical protein